MLKPWRIHAADFISKINMKNQDFEIFEDLDEREKNINRGYKNKNGDNLNYNNYQKSFKKPLKKE
jgi:hypothetical protein